MPANEWCPRIVSLGGTAVAHVANNASGDSSEHSPAASALAPDAPPAADGASGPADEPIECSERSEPSCTRTSPSVLGGRRDVTTRPPPRLGHAPKVFLQQHVVRVAPVTFLGAAGVKQLEHLVPWLDAREPEGAKRVRDTGSHRIARVSSLACAHRASCTLNRPSGVCSPTDRLCCAAGSCTTTFALRVAMHDFA